VGRQLGKLGPAVGGDLELLWEIRSEDGGDGGVFTVGSQPEGYVETMAFEGEFADNLVAAVELLPEGEVGTAISFAATDLEQGKVFAHGEPTSNLDTDTFERRALESCQSP